MLPIDLDHLDLQMNRTAGGPIRVTFPFHSATGTASSAAVLFELDTGDELATHTDSAEETLLVLRGEAEARVGDDLFALRPAEVVVIPAMVPHSVLNTGDATLRVIGFFSAATVVTTFDEALSSGGERVMVIGAPLPIAARLEASAA
jgi:quercetin dioxygenase-like cupin family protein